MVVKYYHGNLSLDKIASLCKTTKTGTSAYHIIKAAESLGFEARGMHCSFENLLEKNVSLPCIVHVTINASYYHYIVIYEINQKQKYLLVADPADKMKKLSYHTFAQIYNDTLLLLNPITYITYEEKELSISLFFKNFCHKYKSLLLYFIVISFLCTFLSILSAFYMKYMVELASVKASLNQIQFTLIFFLFVTLLQSFSYYSRNKISMHMNQKIGFVLTTEIFSYLLSLPYPYYQNRTTGEMISRMQEAQILCGVIESFIGIICIDLPVSILSLAFLFHLQPKLFIYALVIGLLYIILCGIFYFVLPPAVENVQRKKATVQSFLTESIRGYETVQGLHIKKSILQVFEHHFLHLFHAEISFRTKINLLYFIKYTFDKVGSLLFIYIGVILLYQNEGTVGSLLACMTIYSYFLLPLQNTLQEMPQYKEAIVALQRVSHLCITNEDKGHVELKVKGDIVLSHLSYTYNDEKDIFKDFNMNIKAQSKVMILGKSGCGKSTFLKILMKYYEIDRNMVYIDGFDLCDYSRLTIERDICYISQKEILFTDTLYNNVTLWKKVDPIHLQKVLDICEINDIISAHPGGLHMLIEENGFNLSGGERQRIILARALLQNFEILLLDEAMSEIDVAREGRILNKMFSYCFCKTILFVTHRFHHASLFDQILRFEEVDKVLDIRRSPNGKYVVQK